jgi:hypothetical protein
MNNTSGFYNYESGKIKTFENTNDNINMPICFVKHGDKRNQNLLIDTPNELYYNPSTKTLHADNFSGSHSNLIAGEAIKLTHDTTNHTTMIDVNFDENTATTTSISATDIILVQDSLDFLKTITGANLRETLKPTAGANLSYGSGVTINTLNLDTTITGLTKLTVGSSPASDSETGLETYGKIIASRIDSTGIQDLLYLNNGGGVGAQSGIIFRTNSYNAVIRFDETNFLLGSSNAIFDGVLTEWMRINATEMKISGDCNLTSTHKYKINDVIIPYDILADNGLDLSSGILKIDINDCASQSTPGVDDIFIYQLNIGGISKKIKLSELITVINTDTTYLLGNNLSFDDTTSPHTINLSTTLTSMVKIVGATNLTLQTQNEQIFLTGFDGGSGGDDVIWKTNRGSGVIETMKLEGTTNILTLQGKMDITGDYKINGNIIPETVLASNGLNLSAGGVLKIDIASCVAKSTITSTDLFILQIADGTSKKMTGAELLTATGGSDTTYTFTANNLQTVGTNINLNPVLTSMTSVNGQIFFDTKQLVVGEVNNTYSYLASGYSDTQGFLTCGSTSDGSRSSNGNIYNGWKFLYITSNGALEIHRNNGSTTSVPALKIDRALGDITLGKLKGGLNNGAGNFHIDNDTSSGEMFLNYDNNNNVRIGNSATATQASGSILTIFSNRPTPFIIYNNFNENVAIQAGFNCSMQHSLLTNSRIMQSGFYKNNTTTPTNTMGLCSDNGAVKPLWLNCYQHSTTDWPTGGKFSPQGSDCIMRSCFIGVRANAGLFSLTNDPLITLGRSVYDYGFKIAGWNGGAADARYAMIQNSGNLHIDGATAGDTYMNYYASGSGRDCRIYNLEDLSDRRIKNDFEEIDNTELLTQFNQIELLNYNFKDPKFRTDYNRIGFIADSLENQPYFYPFFKQSISPMNMPFDIVNQIELDYVINDNIITFSNYTFDVTKKYYIYCYKLDNTYLTLSDNPLTTTSFEYTFTEDMVKMVVIGEVKNDSKNVSLIKLVPLGFAISRAIIEKNKILENEVIELKNKVDKK